MNLPEHNPPDEIWQNIEAKLNDVALQKAIKDLPIYEPNENLWLEIEKELNPTSKIVRFQVWQRSLAIAASLLLISGLSVLYFSKKDDVKFSEEKIDNSLLLAKTDDSQKQYEMIVAYCKEQNIVCENPEFKSLKKELEELNIASVQLQEAIGQYNTEPLLMAQLTEVEQQKTRILQAMAEKI